MSLRKAVRVHKALIHMSEKRPVTREIARQSLVLFTANIEFRV